MCSVQAQSFILPLFQLVVSDVHFRYEDASTKESLPFAFGITIAKLSAQSTNENWVSVNISFGQDVD